MQVWITTKAFDNKRIQEAVTCIGTNRGLAVTRCVCQDDSAGYCAGFVVTHILSGRTITRHISRRKAMSMLELLAAMTDWRSYETTNLPGSELTAIWDYIKAHRINPTAAPTRFGRNVRTRKSEV